MDQITPGSVTTADLYRELVGLRTDITRTLERLAVIDHRSQNSDSIHSDHEQRLRAVEAFRWKMAGAAIALGGTAGAVASWVFSRR